MTKTYLLAAEVEIEVPFHDLDPMDVVWHGHYAKYFEVARCALLDKLDYNYLQMKASGYAWPVIELQVRYARPARFAQRLRVRAELVEWECAMKIRYLVSDVASGERLTRGHTVQVPVDEATGEMQFSSPEVFIRKLHLPKS